MPSSEPVRAARSVAAKFDRLDKVIAAVSRDLRDVADGEAHWDRLQTASQTVRSARTNWVSRCAANDAARTAHDADRKRLMAICEAIGLLLTAHSLPGVGDLLALRTHDPHAIALAMAECATRLPDVGRPLAALLASSRTRWARSEIHLENTRHELELATRAYTHAFFRCSAVVAEGKAVLAEHGVRPVVRRKGTRHPPTELHAVDARKTEHPVRAATRTRQSSAVGQPIEGWPVITRPLTKTLSAAVPFTPGCGVAVEPKSEPPVDVAARDKRSS